MHGIQPHTASTILRFLDAPALITLDAQIEEDDDGDDTEEEEEEGRSLDGPAAHKFLSSLGLLSPTSGCAAKLESLALGKGQQTDIIAFKIAEGTLKDIAQYLPSLKRLVLCGVQCVGKYDPFLELQIHTDRHEMPLLPQLEYLDITVEGSLNFPLESAFRFIKSRNEHWVRSPENRARDSLRRVVIRFPEESICDYSDIHDYSDIYDTSPTVADIRKLGILVERF